MNPVLLAVARMMLPKRLHSSIFCPAFLLNRTLQRTGVNVSTGPFCGLRYLDASFASVLIPKLLGIYERELHPIIEEALELRFGRIIDIGAAEGYYAVGFAARLPQAKIWAFEADETARHLLRLLAEQNGVADRLTIRGHCGQDNLRDVLPDGSGKTLVVCDAEGAEATLLDPVAVPGLCGAHVLVELHSKTSPGVCELLLNRFRATHEIHTVKQAARHASDYPYRSFPVSLFPRVYLENAVSEFRQPWQDWMSWYWMKPRCSSR